MSRRRKISAVIAAGLLAVSVGTPAQAMDSMVKPAADMIAAAAAAESDIRVSSVKGNTLKPGDRSLLMIGPFGGEYTANSSNPAIVDVEQVLGFWVAVAKADGKAMITVSNNAGVSASIEITVEVGTAAQPFGNAEDLVNRDDGLDANTEIRQEMIRLINQARRENGVPELPVSDALMDAAQDISARRPTGHDAQYESKAAVRYGYSHGVSTNLTRFNGLDRIDSIAEHAVENWMNSTYHRQTLLDEQVTCIGVGVTIYRGTTYCVMTVGDDQSINAYEQCTTTP